MTATLRELIEMASEHTAAVFEPQRVMMMRHICEKAGGDVHVYVCPVSSAAEELMFREFLPRTFKREFARWVFVSEAWMAEGMRPGDPLPAKHPNRIEAIVFVATEGATGKTLAAHRQIYRLAIGGARLLPLVYDDRQTRFMMDAS
jgi:hypothetical protein